MLPSLIRADLTPEDLAPPVGRAARALPSIRAELSSGGARIDEAALIDRIAALPEPAPVIAMVHGWRYGPGLGPDCPHETIFAPRASAWENPRVTSWPRALGLCAPGGDGGGGLGIAFGWPARCDLWTAYARAARAGAALARIAALAARAGRPLHVIAHSMGARLTLSALARAEPGSFGHIVLLAGAEARGAARAALRSPAGRSARIVNVVTRENDLFDAGLEWALHMGLSTAIGQGLGASHRAMRPLPAPPAGGDRTGARPADPSDHAAPYDARSRWSGPDPRTRAADAPPDAAPDTAPAPEQWHDLWLDRPEVLAALARFGHRIAPPRSRICHWSSYLRPGALPLYRAILDGSLPVSALPRALPARRWSRLWPGVTLPGRAGMAEAHSGNGIPLGASASASGLPAAPQG
ncbi:hypothetical protein [Pseudogemmobacter sonorensis]|uniref:hypothetical protein n=1 Tax=Pseudogemmobacter sonorensis TaxID=2989681 RepID=UPI0036ADC8D7